MGEKKVEFLVNHNADASAYDGFKELFNVLSEFIIEAFSV
jgi:hypothetical protein